MVLLYMMISLVFSLPHIVCSWFAPLVLGVNTIGVRHQYDGKRWWNRVELIKFLIANKVKYCVNTR